MSKQTVIIDSDNFTDLESFYDEMDRVLTKDIDWKTGHNLNGFNDLLRGGFGVYDYEEPVKLIWKNISKSRQDLGFDSINCGKPICDIILEIISTHSHIEFEIID